ncbi:MAG: hypothetical protein IJ846_04495 [Alphaproteobacteria bacterium]|nr:hypothetical protein [Alphaproteobacteria bacterium]
MKSKFGRLCAIGILFAGYGFAPNAFAAKYSGGGAARKYSEQPAKYERQAPPPQATAMPEEDLKAVAQVTFDELKLFVRDWRKYSRWLKADGNEYKAVAYLGVSRSNDYPPEVVRWMDEHGWTADRFFLLERKFRTTLSVQDHETKQTRLISHMENQIRQIEENTSLSKEEKQKMKQSFVDMIRSLRLSLNVKAPVSPEEYELIKLNHDALVKVLAD